LFLNNIEGFIVKLNYKQMLITATVAVLAVALVKASGIHKGLPILKKL